MRTTNAVLGGACSVVNLLHGVEGWPHIMVENCFRDFFLHHAASLSREILPPERGCLMELSAFSNPRRILYYIFRTWKTKKDGTRDYARDHGFRAWRIPVYEK